MFATHRRRTQLCCRVQRRSFRVCLLESGSSHAEWVSAHHRAIWANSNLDRSLDELDDDILHELNEVARENQLAYLPFARSGRAEALLFDQYPELAERIERGKRAKIDAIVLSNKYAGGDTPSASFRAQSLEEVAGSPLRQRARRRASNQGKGEAKSPALTPQLKGKSSVADLMFEMSDGEEDHDDATDKIKPLRFTDRREAVAGSPESLWPASSKPRQSALQGTIENGFISPNSLPPSALSGTRSPAQPWGTAPLASEKLDLKDIMAQTPSDKPSGLALGLAKEERERARAAQPKMSQKERKRLQQAQQQGIRIEAPQPAPPTVSPWQAASYRKPSANAILAPSAATPPQQPPQQQQPSPQPSSQPPRAQSTPQLTMRQTIAKGKGKGKGKDKETSTQESSSPSRNAASERGMSVSNTPIPVPMSVRHIPLPSHSPTSPSQSLSIMEILSLQEAEKVSVRDAAAKRSLEEIQQEQEFQQWWEAESKRAIEQEEQAKRAAERAAKAAGKGRGKGRGGASGGASNTTDAKKKGVEGRREKEGVEGKKEKKAEAADGPRREKVPKPRVPKPQPQAPATSQQATQTPNPEAPAFVPPTGSKAESGASSTRGRGRGGQRGGRGGQGGPARGARPPPRNVQSAPVAPTQQVS